MIETTTAAKERPIIFAADSVQAILAGIKTMTRRVVKPQPTYECVSTSPKGGGRWTSWQGHYGGGDHDFACPYGRPGDRLWVRERWLYVGPGAGSGMDDWEREEMANRKNRTAANVWHAAGHDDADRLRWRSPLFMPRWASRLTLEVTGVRVERVQAITQEDVMAEGITERHGLPLADCVAGWHEPFAERWDALNAARGYPWSADPWCWCVSFRVVPQVARP